mmetsp:Transcript_50257/g.84091  ORF Transcript_50257/g.84091 Transcript_50257/m.84091 type:complete len:86 (-) Transcript_50257:443-700(-)
MGVWFGGQHLHFHLLIAAQTGSLRQMYKLPFCDFFFAMPATAAAVHKEPPNRGANCPSPFFSIPSDERCMKAMDSHPMDCRKHEH